MRLGMTAPGNCREVNSSSSKPKSFQLGDTYGLNSHTSDSPSLKPIAVQPLPDIICVMEHTPFLDNLKLSLKKFLDRPPTIHDRQRHILINHYMQRYIFVLTLILILSTITLRAFDSYYIKGKVHRTSWYDFGVLNCVSALISLLPLIFPLIWVISFENLFLVSGESVKKIYFDYFEIYFTDEPLTSTNIFNLTSSRR